MTAEHTQQLGTPMLGLVFRLCRPSEGFTKSKTSDHSLYDRFLHDDSGGGLEGRIFRRHHLWLIDGWMNQCRLLQMRRFAMDPVVAIPLIAPVTWRNDIRNPIKTWCHTIFGDTQTLFWVRHRRSLDYFGVFTLGTTRGCGYTLKGSFHFFFRFLLHSWRPYMPIQVWG